MRSLKKYEAKINKAFIDANELNHLQMFSDAVLSKGRIYLIDEFREYLSKELKKSDVSASACISRVKRIDKECLSRFKSVDLFLYIPFMISTSNDLAIKVLNWIEKFLSIELTKREYSNGNSLPNRQFSDCKSAFIKYKQFLELQMSSNKDIDKFDVRNEQLVIPKLSKLGVEKINIQMMNA